MKEILPPNSKPIILETIYPIGSKEFFRVLLTNNMNKTDLVNKEIDILCDFNIILYLNSCYILDKKYLK